MAKKAQSIATKSRMLPNIALESGEITDHPHEAIPTAKPRSDNASPWFAKLKVGATDLGTGCEVPLEFSALRSSFLRREFPDIRHHGPVAPNVSSMLLPKFYMLMFAILASVGVLLSSIVESRTEAKQKQERLRANADKTLLTGQLSTLDIDNAYLKGKLEIIAGILGSISAHNQDTAGIAKILATSARVTSPSPMIIAGGKEEANLLSRIGATYGDGERLRDTCIRAGRDVNALGNLKQFEEWERNSVSELVEYSGPEILNRVITFRQAVPPESPLSQYCWTFLDKVNNFEELMTLAGNGQAREGGLIKSKH